MNALADKRAHSGNPAAHWLQAIGTCGSVLALVILGASMLLRLTTIFGVEGQPISILPATIENTARLAHRLAASGVGLLVLFAVFLCWTRRSLTAHVVKPVAWIIATTVALALIGPLTSGYQITAVTVANVSLGMVLLMAFWWLRGSSATGVPKRQPVEPLLHASLLVFLLQVATGAAASAGEMHGIRWFSILHLGTALLSTMFIGAALWIRRCEPDCASQVVTAAALLAFQLAMGLILVWTGTRPTWLALIHGMSSPLLALALVSIATHESRNANRTFDATQ